MVVARESTPLPSWPTILTRSHGMELASGDGELATKCRQVAVRCYRLAVVAFDSTSSAGLKRWGDQLMTQADALEPAKDKPEGETDEG